MVLTEVKAGFWTAKVIAGLAVTIVLSLAIGLFGADYARMKRASAQNESRGQLLGNASAGIQDGVTLDQVQQAVNAGLSNARTNFQTAKNEAKRNEPETASRAERVVPDSVRAAYRERRLSRQRLGCAGSECAEDDK